MSLLLPIHLKALQKIPRGSSWRHFSTCRALLREDYVRDRTNVNIVTLGASQHGKTLLCSRLTEVLSAHGVPVKKVSDIDHMAAEKESGLSQSATHLQFWSRDSNLTFS